MAEKRISSTVLARSIGEILGCIRFRGETFIIERNGRPVAVLSPYAGGGSKGAAEALQSWLEAGGKPDLDGAELLEPVGREDLPAEDPWGSP